jgi:cytidylate kinase
VTSSPREIRATLGSFHGRARRSRSKCAACAIPWDMVNKISHDPAAQTHRALQNATAPVKAAVNTEVRKPSVEPKADPAQAPIGGLFVEARTVEQSKVRPAGTLRLHQVRLPSKASFEAAFTKVAGKEALDILKSTFTKTPVVLIAGDQLTGKSTAAKAVAAALGGAPSGTGALMRAMAAERGVTIEQLSKDLATEPDTDVKIDFEAAKKIGAGGASAFESRLAGHLGQFLKKLGRENILSVYLVASPQERALRYLQREVSPEARQRLEPQLKLPADADLEEALAALVALNDPEASAIAGRMKDIANRDNNDLKRLKTLYGVDYQDRSSFDIVVETSGKTPEEVQAAILEAVHEHLDTKA